MIDTEYEKIALEENAKLVKVDVPSLNRFSGVEKRYELYVPYKGIVIEVKNSHSPNPSGSFNVEIPIGILDLNFEIKTKSHLLKLITFSKSITEVKSENANLVADIKSNEAFLKIEAIISKTQFEPMVCAESKNGTLTIRTGYHTLLIDKTSFIQPMIEFYKFMIDKTKIRNS